LYSCMTFLTFPFCLVLGMALPPDIRADKQAEPRFGAVPRIVY